MKVNNKKAFTKISDYFIMSNFPINLQKDKPIHLE